MADTHIYHTRITFPRALWDLLEKRAATNGRKINGEILQILRIELGPRPSGGNGSRPGGRKK